jgi:hypothetical protein
MGALKFRKKPVEIEAMRFDGSKKSAERILDWIGRASGVKLDDGRIVIPTLEGPITAAVGDWVIKGVKGEFYPCKPDIFQATYEPSGPGKA